MRTIAGWLLPYLVNSLWQVPLLYACGWLAARMVRPLAVAAEHRVWVITCLLQSLIPACRLIPLDWFPWLRHADLNPGSVSVSMGTSEVAGAIHLPPRLMMSLAVIYSAVILYFTARLAWRAMRLIGMRHRARPVLLNPETQSSLRLCLQWFRLQDVSVSESSEVFSPVSFGFLRRLVLLPTAMSGSFTNADLRTILAHECAHIYRYDFLKNFLYELLALPVSYHPFCRAARRRVMETREIVCDELAANLTGRTDYAGSLLHLAGLLLQRTSTPTTPAIGIFDARIFERRIMHLTREANSIQNWKRRTITSACFALGLFTCGSAIALRIHVDPVSASVDQSKAATLEQPVKIASGIMAGNKLTGVNPTYPEDAKKKKIQGKVVLSAVINKEGRVEQLTIKSGPAELGPPSVEAVRQWIYKPYMVNGDPVAVQTIVNVTYSLGK